MATRVLSIVIVVVAVVYHVLRLMASSCSGGACDWNIPFSLLLPVLAIVLAGVTGTMAAFQARARRASAILFAACAAIAVAGPMLAAFMLSDNDTKVWVATALILAVPVAVFVRPTAPPGLPASAEGQ